MNSVQEAAHEIVDRVWRRWASFYHDELGGIDPLLHKTSPAEIDLIFRAFFAKYRRVEFDIHGGFRKWRTKPMVSSSVRSASSALAKEFRNRIQRSPLRQQDNKRYIPSLTSIFQAFDNVSPPENRQKAVTPRLLRSMITEKS